MEALPGATFFSCGMSIISALFSDALLFAHGSDVAPALHGVATQMDGIVKIVCETYTGKEVLLSVSESYTSELTVTTACSRPYAQ
ncbi:hypothetical protein AYW79_08400 [Ferroacidibacillus organovorans]|uniref:Uncharacterized protein n=2 Tax=Ferroacidibacillus organovorans TaxID=1765683 RepID=A0A853KAI4_9BACL|nr:hypothetical protein [Ferroacidibacillus organovorans]KYP80737.1 hypothetical protein AYJ22_09980 [Ferroacidibacillus organovorans]OAG93867.1 hypothetical protein AYW79_08400 [Ferroacidibacillus organovorans]